MELKAFLSHRYKSPDVNLYFHKLFAELAEVQFEVDIGLMPTNVTRLERMIRDSDAFIGIYPFPGDPKTRESLTDLLGASKYFRLEFDLAIRSHKPLLVFYDQRYSQVFRFPKTIFSLAFDIQEITGPGGSPQRALFRRVFDNYCEQVNANMAAAISKPIDAKRSEIGILVPTAGPEEFRYSGDHIDAIEEVLNKYGFSRIKRLRWPPILNADYLADIESLDWIIVDIGVTAMSSGIVGYLHGRSVPTLRLLKGVDSTEQVKVQQSYRGLYGGVEVGYQTDIVGWSDVASLKRKMDERLLTLTAPVRRISSHAESEAYFRTASLRKEPVFLSYCGKDAELASQISGELKKRFQKVFDYKDGKSITPGESWLKEIFDKLSLSALGIPLVSSNYIQSGNCGHEAQEMVSQLDAGQMTMIPVKLYKDDRFELPNWMRSTQYMHIYDYPDVPSTVVKIIEFFDSALQKRGKQEFQAGSKTMQGEA
jgi:hypothetical protein